MRILFYISTLASLVIGSSLKIINNQGQCLVFAQDSHGCTGYSAPFAQLDGKDCSKSALDGKITDSDKVKVEICGKENSKQVAWITVDRNHAATFLNQQGDTFTCALDHGFTVGSGCNPSNAGSTSISTASHSASSRQVT